MDPQALFGELDRLIGGASPEERPILAFALASRQETLAVLMLPTGVPDRPASDDGSLSVGEAARRLGVSKDWLYKNKRRLPFFVPVGSRVTFDPQGLERWRKGRARLARQGQDAL